MKKVLLGLLALSATLMAEPLTPIGPSQSTGVTDTNGGNRIDINTKAFIIDSGLIITGTPDGGAIKSIELDHGTIMKGTNVDSSVERNVFIKKTHGNFPEGAILNITIESQSNVLQGLSSEATIPHRLTATIDDTATAEYTQILFLAGENVTKAENVFTVRKKKSSVGINLRSDITSMALNNTNLAEGAYSNTSTLSVKFSKIPTAPGTPADTTR
ncbi:hypothetical protein [Cetobacterium sp.]|uniref:hypothetical protein n=1 Tax=Cetobacterium sp. TaxID=2071632 RepID=UPI003EE656CC